MDQDRIDHVIQLALLVAGREDDPFDRELGPIHLIKYVYLADLAYAERHGGETYTGPLGSSSTTAPGRPR